MTRRLLCRLRSMVLRELELELEEEGGMGIVIMGDIISGRRRVRGLVLLLGRVVYRERGVLRGVLLDLEVRVEEVGGYSLLG